jgi:uncharacterized membrane-anchored protein
MARKKRKDEKEEEYEWVPPEFDEKAFLLKDIVGTKALMITAAMAIVFGIISFAVGATINNYVGFLAYIAGAIVLNYSYKYLKINRADIDKKTMIGNVALYFLLALGIWIVMMNPPFS